MAALLSLILTIVVIIILIGLVFWAVRRLSGAFGIPAPLQASIEVVLVVILVIALLALLVGGVRVPMVRIG